MKKTRTHKSIIKNLWTYALAFLLVLSNFTSLIQADEPDPQVDPSTPVVEETEAPADENLEDENTKPQEEIPEDQTKPTEEDENSENTSENAEGEKTIEEDADESENDGLEISDEVKPEAVGAGDIEAPTITKAFIGTSTISGGNLHRGKINGKNARGTIHLTLKDSSGNEKATVSVTPKSGTTWKVNLPSGVTIAEGDVVTAYQEFDGQKSSETTANAEPSKASTVTLTMPTGEIWIEQTSSNQVNDDEQAEAVQMLKDANPAIASDIKSVKFSIDGTDHAYYEVTYTDGSTAGKIEATGLTIRQVTETSMGADLDNITVVDNVIKGQLAGEEPFDGIKVQIILKLSDAVKGSYCDGGSCSVDKDTSKPVDAVVDSTTGEFTYTIPNPDLKLDQAVGVTVKEPHKFKSCSKTIVIAPTPKKTEVKDPKKLTDADKGKIIETIKTAYTVDGVSKLPNGTGDWDGVPAVIQFDDSGNVKIFSGNDVAGTWDPNNGYKFVPEINADGSYKVVEGAQPKITIQAKDLVKNIKPDAPTLAHDADKPEITITPNEKDTDAQKIVVTYTGTDGKNKTLTATKNDQGAWSTDDNEVTVTDKGVITLPTSKIQGDSKITATVTDIGGLTTEEGPLDSTEGNVTLSKAQKVKDLGGLDPVDMKKWVGDELNWKEGVKAKDSNNETEVKKLLDKDGTSFTDTTRNTSAEGDFPGTIKVTFDDGSSLEVADQTLYVSNHVTNMNRKDKVPTNALDVQFKLGEGVKVEDKDLNTGEVTKTTKGDKNSPVLYKEYKVKPGTNLSDYKHPTLQKTIFELIDDKADDGYENPVWKGQDANNANNFVVSSDNNIFTATATSTAVPNPEPNPGNDPGTDNPGTNPGNNPNPNPGDYPGPSPWDYPPEDYFNPSEKPVEKPVEKPEEKPGQELERGFHERYLYGYVDGTVRPEGFITRCEAAALIARLANLDMINADKPNFPDTPSAWYNTAINAVVAKNLMFADANGNFRPHEPITRGEFARALYYIDRHNDEVAPFEDIKGHIYEAAINQAYGNGLINGYLDGTFKPDAPIQRAEATKILNKYANRGVDSDGLSLVRQDLIHFTDIDERHWAYYEIMEAANTHEYERVVSTLYETWLKIVYDTKMK